MNADIARCLGAGRIECQYCLRRTEPPATTFQLYIMPMPEPCELRMYAAEGSNQANRSSK